MVRRADGSAARLHPSNSQDAKPVVGSLGEWELGTCAPTPGQASVPTLRGPVSHTHGHVDVVSSERAHAMFMDYFHAHTGPPAELALDLLTGDFPWNTFLMGRPSGQTILEQGVAIMRLVSRDGEAVIEVPTRSAARPQYIVFKKAAAPSSSRRERPAAD